MKTLDDYEETLFRFTRDYLARLATEQVREKLAEAMRKHLWDIDGSHSIERDLTPHDVTFLKVFCGFNEITLSYLYLCDIEIYVGRFPYGDTAIPRSRHLEYHITNYLHEVYILKSRLQAYLKRIRREYRKSPKLDEKALDLLDNLVEKTFTPIVKARGVHVHEYRYSDDDLDRIHTWELLASHPSNEEDGDRSYKLPYDRNYKEVRREWVKRIKANNDNIKRLLDDYFGELYSLVFQKNGDLRFPKSGAGA